jgi:hypothetical protein
MRLRLFLFAVAIFYVAAFAAMVAGHIWLWDAQGKLAAYDFVDVYAAGKLALAHHAAGAYDWPAHRAAESAALGYTIAWKDYFGWHYPPPFFFPAAALALLPYLAAFLAWSIATLPLYLAAMRRIVGSAQAWLAGFAFPATFYNISVGQNGFLTAGLIGGSLATLEAQPILSGVLLGLLTYKPQFGILFPFALAAGGYWRAFASATVTALVLAGISLLAFGSESWLAFVRSVPVTVDAVFVRGLEGWGKLNSLYGVCRWAGLGAQTAAAIQFALTAVLVVAIVVLWRSQAPFARKAAALATATLLATPYVYIYDFPILAVAIAFLWRERTFVLRESLLTAIACAAIAIFPFAHAATGLIATLCITAIIVLRCPVRRPSRLPRHKAGVAPQGDVPTYGPNSSS